MLKFRLILSRKVYCILVVNGDFHTTFKCRKLKSDFFVQRLTAAQPTRLASTQFRRRLLSYDLSVLYKSVFIIIIIVYVEDKSKRSDKLSPSHCSEKMQKKNNKQT